MPLNITTEPAPAPYAHVTIMRPEGRATLGGGADTLADAIRAQKPGTNLLLDMTGVSNADSSGIDELESGFTRDRQQRGTVENSGASETS